MKSIKKAVFSSGGKQYIVTEGETVKVELLKTTDKTTNRAEDKTVSSVSFEALLLIDGDKVSVGAPFVSKVMVSADVVEDDVQADKVTSIRYKAKKRVHKVRGHRQHQTTLKIISIV